MLSRVTLPIPPTLRRYGFRLHDCHTIDSGEQIDLFLWLTIRHSRNGFVGRFCRSNGPFRHSSAGIGGTRPTSSVFLKTYMSECYRGRGTACPRRLGSSSIPSLAII